MDFPEKMIQQILKTVELL